MKNLFRTRLNRSNFLVGVIVVALAYLGILFLVMPAVTYGAVSLLIVLVLVALLVLSFSLLARRINDIGISQFFILLILVPYLGLLFLVYLLVWKSQEGINKFGNPLVGGVNVKKILLG